MTLEVLSHQPEKVLLSVTSPEPMVAAMIQHQVELLVSVLQGIHHLKGVL